MTTSTKNPISMHGTQDTRRLWDRMGNGEKMYVDNGIAYAEKRPEMPTVCGVRAMDNHVLWVRFDDGEARTYDFTPLLDKPVFMPLADEEVFKSVYIDYGAPTWNDGRIDFDPETIYNKGIPV